MPLPLYLAMTAAEISKISSLPAHLAYMACHFSPYNKGLSNFPEQLPEGSMLILNDQIPVQDHDPERITVQMKDLVGKFHISSVLLDLERPGNNLTRQIARLLCESLPCRIAVTAMYADGLDCGVFLQVKPYEILSECCEPWKGRDIWLDGAVESLCIQVTKDGAAVAETTTQDRPLPFYHSSLCAHYQTEVFPDQARFYIGRQKEDVSALLEQAKAYGVSRMVGLWQELKD